MNAVVPEIGSGPVERIFTSHLAATLATITSEGYGLAWLLLTTIYALASGLVRAGSEHQNVRVEIRLFADPTDPEGGGLTLG